MLLTSVFSCTYNMLKKAFGIDKYNTRLVANRVCYGRLYRWKKMCMTKAYIPFLYL